MSAPSEAERLWRKLHGITAYAWEPGLCGSGCEICGAVRAAFEEGARWGWRPDAQIPYTLPPWLPAGAKEDK